MYIYHFHFPVFLFTIMKRELLLGLIWKHLGWVLLFSSHFLHFKSYLLVTSCYISEAICNFGPSSKHEQNWCPSASFLHNTSWQAILWFIFMKMGQYWRYALRSYSYRPSKEPARWKLWDRGYSHLSNKRGGWNKRGGGAKNAKSLNVE